MNKNTLATKLEGLIEKANREDGFIWDLAPLYKEINACTKETEDLCVESVDSTRRVTMLDSSILVISNPNQEVYPMYAVAI